MSLSDEELNARRRLKLLSCLSSGLRDQQRSGKYCDVTIKVDGVPYKCHKSVLCAVSPYFSAMFAHDMKESRESVVVLHEIKSDIFEILLDCIYNGDDIITDENVQDILEIATLMQIDMLLERVEEYFKENLTVKNFVDTWYLAKKYNCGSLEQYIWKFMTENFMALSQNGDLALLPVETFAALLSDDQLVAQSEDVVCDTALQWIAADIDDRLRYVPKLISTVRVPLCSPEYVFQRLNLNKEISNIPEVKFAIQNAIKFRMYLARKQESTSVQTTQRASSTLEDVMVVVGGADSSENSGSGMRGYSFLGQTWFSLPPLPQKVGPYYALCTYGDDIFVSGGQYNREAFHKFQASTCTWVELPKMPSERYQHSMASVSDAIYVFGGEGSSEEKVIHGYQVPTGLWESYGSLLESVKHVKSIVQSHNILIFGSNANNYKMSDIVQSFDVMSRQVTRITTLKLPGSGCQAITCDSEAYFVGNDGTINRLNEDSTVEFVGKLDNFRPKRFGISQYRGMLHITTTPMSYTENGDHAARVMVFDIEEKKVTDSFTIPNTDLGDVPWLCNGNRLACTRIAIGKHHLIPLRPN